MQVNIERVVTLRRECDWSQDELATAAGLSPRTVQRVENSGTASLQTLKALAAALETSLEELKKPTEEKPMAYEYKTIVMPFKTGLFNQVPPDVTTALNKEGREGWRLSQMCAPIGSGGATVIMIAILERQLPATR